MFFALPLPIIEVPCFALAIITWRSTQCLCPASPSIRYHAVAAQGFSQPGLAVASQCNALRALPLHSCSLPLPDFAKRGKSMPSHLMSKLSRSFATLSQSTPSLCRSSPVISSLFLCWSPLSFSVLCHAVASRNRATLRRCIVAPPVLFSALALRSLRVNATPLPSLYKAGRHQSLASRRLSSPHHALALKARTRPCSLRSARTRTCP